MFRRDPHFHAMGLNAQGSRPPFWERESTTGYQMDKNMSPLEQNFSIAQLGVTKGSAEAPSREGTSSSGIPKKPYDTPKEAGREGANSTWSEAKGDRQHEWTGPIGQLNGSKQGGYIYGPAERGMGMIPYGKAHAGDQGSYIDRLPDRLPRGSHLVGYYTVHILNVPSPLKSIDAPRFQEYWGFNPTIVMKSPGRNQNWERPTFSYYP